MGCLGCLEMLVQKSWILSLGFCNINLRCFNDACSAICFPYCLLGIGFGATPLLYAKHMHNHKCCANRISRTSNFEEPSDVGVHWPVHHLHIEAVSHVGPLARLSIFTNR